MHIVNGSESLIAVIEKVRKIRNDAAHSTGSSIEDLKKMRRYIHEKLWLQKIAETSEI